MRARLKSALNTIAAVFIVVWLLSLICCVAWFFGLVLPPVQLYSAALLWLDQTVFIVANFEIKTWRLVAMVVYTFLYAGLLRLLWFWTWFRAQFSPAQDAPALVPPAPPVFDQDGPPKLDPRFRIEIPDARPYAPQIEPPRQATPPPRTETSNTPPPVESRYRVEVVSPRQATPPPSAKPTQRRKIPSTYAEWVAKNPKAKLKIRANLDQDQVIHLPGAKEMPVIELGPSTPKPTFQREKPRPPRPRSPTPPGEKKPKKLRKYQRAAENELD